MTYDSDALNIVCSPSAFNFIETLFTFLYSTSIGVVLSFALVAFFMNGDSDGDDDGDGDDKVEVENDAKASPVLGSTNELDEEQVEKETDTRNEAKSYMMQCNAEFNALPKEGYVIDTYPFSYKLETSTPFGDVIMFLNVYNDDYVENEESIEYTYYTQTNAWTFERLLSVAKKIAVKLNTQQFYKDKTICCGTTKEELIAQRERVRELAMAAAAENTLEEAAPEDRPPEEPSVFAKFKSYNTGNKNGNVVQKKPIEQKDDIVITPVKMRRAAGTLEEYKVKRLKEEVKKRMKHISFSDFSDFKVKK